MNLEIFDNTDFNNKNLQFSEIPNQEQRTYLKQNGYSFTSRYGGVWYPRTYEAKKANKEFVKLFAEKFYPSVAVNKADTVTETIISAPNGIPSNLSVDDYAYVHGEVFKNKFGDWEKAWRLEKLRNAPVIEKDGSIIIEKEDISDEINILRNVGNNKILGVFAKEIGRKITGIYHNRDLNVDISVNMGAINEIKNHHISMNGHLEVIQYIPEIINEAIYISEEKNNDKQKHPNIEKYQYFVSGIKIAGEEYTCKSVVGVDVKGRHYYDQRLSQIEKGKFINIIQSKNKSSNLSPLITQRETGEGLPSDNVSPLLSRGKSEESYDYDTRLIQICQCPQLPFLDKNFEPTKDTIEAVRQGTLYFTRKNNVDEIIDTKSSVSAIENAYEYGRTHNKMKSVTDDALKDLGIAHSKIGEGSDILQAFRDGQFARNDELARKALKTSNTKAPEQKDPLESAMATLESYYKDSVGGMTIQTVKAKPKDIVAIRIECRKILEKSDDEITDDDKKILAQYEGAGGIKEKNRTVNGILNEFYTPQAVVEKVWKLVDAYAPNAKTVLEPSSGIGKFANNRPNNIFTFHEIDETSARIAKLIHPDATLIQGAYQKQFFDENERAKKSDFVQPLYDVVIGNPPYGEYSGKYKGMGEGKEFDRYEEYFIAKGLDALKDDTSLLAFVVPSGFLDTADDKQKQIIAEKGILIDAYRLPEGTFPTTEVGTDIILMKKNNQNNSENARFLSDGAFFKEYPEKILGEIKTRKNRWGKEEQFTATHTEKTIQDELNKIDGFADRIIRPSVNVTEDKNIHNPSTAAATTEHKKTVKKETLNTVIANNRIMHREEFCALYGKKFDEHEFAIWKATDWEGFIDLSKLASETVQALKENEHYVQASPGKWTHKVLFTTGDIYTKLEKQKELLLSASEQEKTLYQNNITLLEQSMKQPVKMENIHFGLQSSLAENFMIPFPCEDGTTVTRNLQEAFILWAQNETPDSQKGRWSLDFATANISREDLPDNVSWFDIIEFIDRKSVKAERTSKRTYGESAAEIKELKNARRKEAEEKRQSRSDTANKLFDKFLHEGLDKQTQEKLVYVYNKQFNSYIIPDYAKLPLFIDEMNATKGESEFKLYDQQIKGISFLCNKGNGLLAYDVGVGKTAAGIVATINQMQAGRSKRPLIIVPNQVYAKWYTDIRELFPNVHINALYNMNDTAVAHYVNKDDPHTLYIPENSITLVTEQALEHITFTDNSCDGPLFEDFSNLLSIDFDDTERKNAADAEKIKSVIGTGAYVKDTHYYFFENCGFDNLTVDEAHRFKNLWVKPRAKIKGESNEYSGIPSGVPSKRALKMYAMTQLIQRNNNDRNVFLLTATPFTNSPLEVYSMLSYVGRKRLKAMGINSLRDFLNNFAETKIELAVNAKGEIDTKQVMKSWKQLSALQGILTEFIDKVDGEEAGIIRPKKFTHVKPLDMTELQKQMCRIDEDRMSEVKEGNSAAVLQAMTNMRIAMVAPALANQANYPNLTVPPIKELVETSPKLKFVCDAIIDMYKTNPEKGQFMYLPLGKEAHGFIKDYLIAHGIPKDAVEIINGSLNNSVDKKDLITGKFNDEKDKLKILIGGQNTCEGIDLNGNSFVMANCSLGWNPSETIQAEGRIWRQGNLQGHVHIVYPVMNDSIDSVLYQKHDEKRSRINELWNYKGDNLNVEDINPEELKIELIKDPIKRSKLILDERTKESRLELSKINLKIVSYDEIINKKIKLNEEKDDIAKKLANTVQWINETKAKNQSVPDWMQSNLKRYGKKIYTVEQNISAIDKKLGLLGIHSDEEHEQYIRMLNEQKRAVEKSITNFKNKELPKIIDEMKRQQLKDASTEYPVDMQRTILENDILHNLRPMKEVEYEIKTIRFENMLDLKLSSEEISQNEYDLYKKAGFENYEKFMNGEIESLEKIDLRNGNNTMNENTEKEIENKKQLSDLYTDPLSLFYEETHNDGILVKSPQKDYGMPTIDDESISEKQITESERMRDKIIFPVLNGKESGMYKAFKDFAEHGVFDIIGKSVDLTEKTNKISATGWRQLQATMQIYRCKQFETFRYVLIDRHNGEITDQMTVSSHMPDRTVVSSQGNDTLRQVLSRAEEKDCLIVAVHNHPSGNVEASDYDITTTDRIEKLCKRSDGLNRFAGHIILDHNSFNLYTPQKGWNMHFIDNANSIDELSNQNFIFNKMYINTSKTLINVAKKINDTNNWNDNFIPVAFVDADYKVSGIKLYDKSFFDNTPQRIRNEFQFSGIEAGAVAAFPVITKNFTETMSVVDAMLFEDKLKNLVQNHACCDVALPTMTVTEKYAMAPGRALFDTYNARNAEIHATWQTKINPDIFYAMEEKKECKKSPVLVR